MSYHFLIIVAVLKLAIWAISKWCLINYNNNATESGVLMEVTKPKISVIIPCYNVEKYLRQCLDSVINQTLKEIEIICINDGSTDSTLQILEEYAGHDNRIRIISQENQGQSVARNKGLDIAFGEFIAFIDSDDSFLYNNALETALKTFTNDIDFINFGIFLNIEPDVKTKIKDKDVNPKLSGKIKICENIMYQTPVYACNKIFRKSIIDKYALRFPVGLLFEDCVFTYSYLAISNYGYYLNDKFYSYLIRKGSTMNSLNKSNKKGIDHIYCMKELFNFYYKNNLIVSYKYFFESLFIQYIKLAIKYSLLYLPQILKESLQIAQYIVEQTGDLYEKSRIEKIANNRIYNIKELKIYKRVMQSNLYKLIIIFRRTLLND